MTDAEPGGTGTRRDEPAAAPEAAEVESRIEVRLVDGDKEGYTKVYEMRDAKDPDGPVLIFTPAEWEAFRLGVLDGEFDDLAEEAPAEETAQEPAAETPADRPGPA